MEWERIAELVCSLNKEGVPLPSSKEKNWWKKGGGGGGGGGEGGRGEGERRLMRTGGND